ncbi:MAG: hypothetical protein AB7E85_09535 [Pseudobdellovibrionaceae bacterium]
MIEAIGVSRAIFIGLLLFLNVVLAGGTYMYMSDATLQASRELIQVRGAAETKRQEVLSLRTEFDKLQGRIRDFKRMQINGFFDDQNRIEGSNRVDQFRAKANLLNATLNIEPGEIVENQRLVETTHVFLQSPININIEAQDDLDVYTFMKLMETQFPGKIILKSFDIKRTGNISDVVLRSIATGTPVPLVQASVVYEWVSLPSKEELQ